ncbi:MAG: hypothetical protein DI601_00285 [Azospirillum brasilense]|nr:MAG: hypothetical protein DI601_00285 [Azospirillum brasilense]
MDRPLVYPAAIPLDSDILVLARDAMVAVGSAISLAADLSGGRVIIDGLHVVPTAPASMRVVVVPGRAYAERVVDAIPYGTLPADSDVIARGARTDGATYLLAAPSQPGAAQKYLVQATVSEADTGATVLPYYNAAAPSQAYSGPENSGQPQMTRRESIVALQLKVGVPATVGSALPPPVDAGWVAVAEIEVRNGDVSLDSTRIIQRGDGRLPKLGDVATRASMDASIAAEAAARAAADTAEWSARIATDNALQAQINAVNQGRIDGDSAEAQARDNADRGLSARLSIVEPRMTRAVGFDQSRTWTVPDGVTVIRAYIAGGGGGGAGANPDGKGGGGGGAGGTCIALLGVTPGQVVSVVVGHGGAGGAAGQPGQPGGTSSLLGVSAGGAGGGGSSPPAGGPGGDAWGGLGSRGGNGGDGGGAGADGGNYGGDGAASYWGGGGRAATGASDVQHGRAWGSGGGGGYGSPDTSGGTGSWGVVYIEY